MTRTFISCHSGQIFQQSDGQAGFFKSVDSAIGGHSEKGWINSVQKEGGGEDKGKS